MQLLGQLHQSHLFVKLVAVWNLESAEDGAGEGERGASHDRWLGRDKVLVVEGNLADVPCHVLHLHILVFLGQGDLQEAVDRRMTDPPVERVQHVPLHLCEHLLVVEVAAHGLQLPDGWHAILTVTVLGGDQEGGTADQLVVTLVDNALGAVPVEEVDGKEKGLGEKLEGRVGLDEEVEEVRSHEPLDLSLDVNRSHIW